MTLLAYYYGVLVCLSPFILYFVVALVFAVIWSRRQPRLGCWFGIWTVGLAAVVPIGIQINRALPRQPWDDGQYDTAVFVAYAVIFVLHIFMFRWGYKKIPMAAQPPSRKPPFIPPQGD